MNRPVSSGVVAGVLIAIVVILAGLWALKSRQDKQAAEDRRATILRGAGGAPRPRP